MLVFLSHSSSDKPLARRIARRLGHRGVEVWIDESKLQIGDQLSNRIIEELLKCKFLLVLMTPEALKSKWVSREIEVARGADIPPLIIPLIGAEGLRRELIDDSLGTEIFDPLTIEERFDELASVILSEPICPRNLELLDQDLNKIIEETPELKGLIAALMAEQITLAQSAAVRISETLRHPTETALIALYERSSCYGRYVISLVAADFFRQHGIGFPVLLRQVRCAHAESDHVNTMFFSLGNQITRAADFYGVFRLFEVATNRHELAFKEFVIVNFDRFDDDLKERSVEYTVFPDRGPGGVAIDLAFELFSRMPDNSALKKLWYFWVNDYRFGGLPGEKIEGNIGHFYACMNEAAAKGLSQFDPIIDHFRSCFRRLVKSSNMHKINEAIYLLLVATDKNYIGTADLSSELINAIYSAEWDQARWGLDLGRLIHKLADAANGKGDFYSLFESYRDAYLKLKIGEQDVSVSSITFEY